jgi:hypothetical protein
MHVSPPTHDLLANVTAHLRAPAAAPSAAHDTAMAAARDFDERDIMQEFSAIARRHPSMTVVAAMSIGFLVGRSSTRT